MAGVSLLAAAVATVLADATATAGGCRSAHDCSLAGSCAAGACACFPGWAGPRCAALDVRPTARDAGWRPTPTPGSPQGSAGKNTWGAAPVRGHDGRYHIFATMFVNGTVWHPGWYNRGVIVQATSTRPAGPYTYRRTVLEPRGAGYFDATGLINPIVLPLRDGSWALYYTGSNCLDANQSFYGPCDQSVNASIGAAHTTDLDGEWTRLDKPLVEAEYAWEGGGVANPAVIEMPERSQILLAFRGGPTAKSPIGDHAVWLATAPRWDGPFERINGGRPMLDNETLPGAGNLRLEDPYLLRVVGPDKSVSYHMLFHSHDEVTRDGRFMGAHAYSRDGLHNWTLAQTPAYSCPLPFTDGTVHACCRYSTPFASARLCADKSDIYTREEPKLLFTSDGRISHLFNAVCTENCTHSYVVAVPVGEDPFDEV